MGAYSLEPTLLIVSYYHSKPVNDVAVVLIVRIRVGCNFIWNLPVAYPCLKNVVLSMKEESS